MKRTRYFYSLLVVLLTISSCTENDLMLFGDEHHIYFDKFYKDAVALGKETADSTLVSFFFENDDVNEIEAKLVVHITGKLLEQDRKFGLRVIPELTTANSDEYKMDEIYVFRANNVSKEAKNQSDTISIKMLRSERLKDMPYGVRLCVELIPMDDLQLGQTERTRAVINLTRDAIKPEWWDAEVTSLLLGNYSSKKYKLFLQHIDPKATLNANMLKNEAYKARELVQRFKKWLAENPEQAKEEDGSPMTVNV